jgi:hypothetical protein
MKDGRRTINFFGSTYSYLPQGSCQRLHIPWWHSRHARLAFAIQSMTAGGASQPASSPAIPQRRRPRSARLRNQWGGAQQVPSPYFAAHAILTPGRYDTNGDKPSLDATGNTMPCPGREFMSAAPSSKSSWEAIDR